MNRSCLSFTVVVALFASCPAADGDPVALIRLPGGGVAIETMWDQTVIVTDSLDDLNRNLPGIDLLYGDAANATETADRFRRVMDPSQP